MALLDNFHVVTMISNPVRFESRYRLYKQFERHMAESGVRLWTCEVQQGNRPFAVTNAGNPRHLQLRTVDEIWHKENALNLIIQRLPSDWEYVAWIDADVEFLSKNWAKETVEQLQNYEVVQLFQTAIDLGPHEEVLHTHQGFAYCYVTGKEYRTPYGGTYWHPGFAYAATRKAFEGFGCLFDVAILGAGDHHMAMSLIGRGADSVPKDMHPDYLRAVLEWQARAEKNVKREFGFVPGTLRHFYHGQKQNRQYWGRWKILVDEQYSPFTDIYRDSQGLYRLDDDRISLRDKTKGYFRTRDEDGVTVAFMR